MKKYAFWVKGLTFVMCVMLALCVAVSGLGVLFAGGSGMYNFSSFSAWLNDHYYDIADNVARNVVREYAAAQSDSPQWLLEQYGFGQTDEDIGAWFDLSGNDWYYIIKDANGKTVRSTQNANVEEPLLFVFDNVDVSYPVIAGRVERVYPTMTPTEAPDTTQEPTWAASETDMEEPSVDQTEPVTTAVVEYSDVIWDPYNGEEVYVRYESADSYNVTVGISKYYVGYSIYSGLPQGLLEWLFSARMALIAMIAVSFCLFAAAFVFLMIIAGKDPVDGEAAPKALNKLPLDLYLAAGVFGTVLGLLGAYELLDILFYENNGYNVLVILLLCGCGIAVATLDMGFFTALAAQCKVRGGYWWRNSICGRVLRWIWKGIRVCARYTMKVLALLPVIWEWLLVAFILALGLFITMLITYETGFFLILLWWCGIGVVAVGYGGWCYGNIRKGIRRMKEGNLHEKIDTQWMYGSFKSIAEDLNALADVAAVAADKQLKAERMKAELVTNVSHDIKTPLTSVINYVDLLQQPHTEEEGKQYLEVLARQSDRLKRLVEDLMDMSKASTGNMTVNMTVMDGVEAVNQALGEFADKLAVNQLTPVFRCPMEQMHMYADGRITWRVLSNLLGNVVKYALPGTRVYLDLNRQDQQVVLSIKNISREELNITAEELTERFVRGDASRNTEGSGLGLNIAQSLMQLQKGSLELTVDGDLFKVTLIFPTE